MRVAVIHNLRHGGAHRRLSNQVRHLRADVVEICLATAVPVTDDGLVLAHRPLAERAPRPLRPPFRYLDLTSLVLAWLRVAEALRRLQADVVFANPCRFLQGPPALIRTPVPSLYFCDEPRWVDYDPTGAATLNPRTRILYGPLHAAERRLDQAAVRHAALLATNSRYSAGEIQRAYGREAVVLPLGVPEFFTPGSASPRHLLSVGTLIPEKGHDLVIEAAACARTRRLVVVIAPRPEWSEQARLTRLAQKLGVELCVRTGISDHELRRVYREAHVTLYLSRAEPLGLASLEAQACGSPVVVAAEGGLPETVQEGVTGWAVARHPKAVALRIDALEDPVLRARMSSAAAQRGAEASWSKSAAALSVYLEDLCAAA